MSTTAGTGAGTVGTTGNDASQGAESAARRSARLRARARRPVTPDLYGIVLVLLAVCYLLFAVTTAVWGQVATAALTLVALVLAVRTSRPTRRMQRSVQVVAAVGLLVTVVALAALPRKDAIGAIDATFALVLLFTLLVVLGRVLEHRTVTLPSIAAALSGYLILGMMFTHVFGVVAWLDPPFFADGEVVDGRALQYFSFTTLTTLGYGDLTAGGYAGRGLATFEALIGQIYLVTIVARLVASWRGPASSAEPDPTAPDSIGPDDLDDDRADAELTEAEQTHAEQTAAEQTDAEQTDAERTDPGPSR
jgi:hypothetical protein